MKTNLFSIFLCLALSLNLVASVKLWEGFDLFSKENLNIPKKLHAIWVGPHEMHPAFIENLTNFPDFEVHLWTSWDTDRIKKPLITDQLLVHSRDELEQTLGSFLVDENKRTLLHYVNREIELECYACVKDIIQHVHPVH
jgi:hypothetical protein